MSVRRIVELVAAEAERLGVAIDVADLAERLAAAADEGERPRLASTCAAIVVASGPVQALARSPRVEGVEHARRILTVIASQSRAVDAEVSPERWRYRPSGAARAARAAGGELTDVTLRVVRERVYGAEVAVVVAASWQRRSAGRR